MTMETTAGATSSQAVKSSRGQRPPVGLAAGIVIAGRLPSDAVIVRAVWLGSPGSICGDAHRFDRRHAPLATVRAFSCPRPLSRNLSVSLRLQAVSLFL